MLFSIASIFIESLILVTPYVQSKYFIYKNITIDSYYDVLFLLVPVVIILVLFFITFMFGDAKAPEDSSFANEFTKYEKKYYRDSVVSYDNLYATLVKK